ncbi:MAG: isoleucyl-tRNA synthetase [Candidatus Saganbacteria bacterium]|uniref:Isoleucine--tRNA ligase n=1 Tax=Candidatus Saganbacteria bacterium TaxID=2575572 RepID=A0A833L1V5_UNCSA|nr:MAG: isoleucyl-tRNA synthetase [Candidatus Saganbacteria bacterium]
MEYKQTLNLPKTDFPIRANLKKVEEEIESFWFGENIYQKIIEKNSNKNNYILHDGPPYPNGDIHLGHALNKILKDIIVKYKNLAGFRAPYVPGWDCHGLPIETQLIKELGDKRKDLSSIEFRKLCKEYALKYVSIQREEFKRLGIFGDWDNPYLTLNKIYEAGIVKVFGELAERGYIYRGLKPIHWCPNDETALAEAELEYEDDRSPSIYVKFQVLTPLPEMRSFVIWTTTPWTLPANVAIAIHPEYEYVFLKVKDGTYVIAEGLVEDFVKRLNITDYKIIDKKKGASLEGIKCRHPFINRESIVVLDKLVTLEQGTGCVHIAPGHGAEDFLVGLKYKLPVIMPVDSKGYFDSSAGEFAGKKYDEANKLITEKMKLDGTLLHLEFIKHSYPHCWRCKKPVIFRATEQWFVSIDHNDLRKKSLDAIGKTKWFPSWGENRIRGMVESRPDWCISRQRMWGAPIPAFYCKKCGKPQIKGIFNKSVQELFLKEGSDAWFIKDPKDILPAGTKCPDCGENDFKKETDILDVWFESGSSHAAVLETNPSLSWPADLYLEGSDQHRGWFQTSLLTSMCFKERPPFNAVLTHGFTIDDHGKKMSKSLGNVIDPQEVVKKYGADVLRLWVASTDFRADMAASDSILKQAQDAYLKIRNTCRFLLSNLYDFEKPLKHSDLLEFDKYILLKFNKLIDKVLKAYDNFDFHIVYHSIYSFCINELSSLYLDANKDRLYCGGKNSIERRSAQTAMDEILKGLIILISPILSYTAEDIQRYYKKDGSIFFKDMPKAEHSDEKLEAKWEIILEARKEILKALEESRNKKEIAASLDAKVLIKATGDRFNALKSIEPILSMILIVSRVELTEGENSIIISHADGQKCERCWIWTDKSPICARCAEVISNLP